MADGLTWPKLPLARIESQLLALNRTYSRVTRPSAYDTNQTFKWSAMTSGNRP